MKIRSIFPLFFFLSSQLVLGQTYIWNLGANGNWDTTTPNWTGAGTTWVNSATSDAVFGGSSVLVTLTQPITANSLTFNTSAYTVTTSNSSSLTLAGTAILNTNIAFGTSISLNVVGSSRVDLQACKLEYSIVSPK